jgi:hypothetical protein
MNFWTAIVAFNNHIIRFTEEAFVIGAGTLAALRTGGVA